MSYLLLVPRPAFFSKLGLYVIFDGVNDISYAIQANSTVDRIRSVILPEIVSNVSLAITVSNSLQLNFEPDQTYPQRYSRNPSHIAIGRV